MNIAQKIIMKAEIMPLRLNPGIESLEIFQKTGLMFMQYSNNPLNENIFKPISMVEPGFILILPIISNLTKISYEIVANYFFYFLLFLSMLSIFYFISKSVNKINYKIYSYFFVILVNFYMYNRLFGLVVEWLLYFYSAQLIIPLIILIINKKLNGNFSLIGAIFFMGVLIDQFRSYASLGAIIFLTFALIYHKENFFKKSLVLIMFIFYLIIPQILNSYIENKQKENYFKLFNANYHTDVKVSASVWYTTYRGLGFINGKLKGYNDEVIHEFLEGEKNNKHFAPSNENNKLLKGEIIRIIKNDPSFALRLYSAKFGVILTYFIIFANIGLYFMLKNNGVTKFTKILFMLAFFCYSIPPLLAIPVLPYLGGIIGLGMILHCYMLSLEKPDFCKN